MCPVEETLTRKGGVPSVPGDDDKGDEPTSGGPVTGGLT